MSDLNAKVLTSQKLEKLLDFLGIHMCFECRGKGRITRTTCSCCQPETETCPECKGNEFIINEHSFLKSTFDHHQEIDDEGIGLCD